MRLNVWVRLGIVLSGLWMAVAPASWYLFEVGKWNDLAEFIRSSCVTAARSDPAEVRARSEPACWSQYRFDLEHPPEGIYQDMLIACAITAAVAWLIIVITVILARWVLAGRKARAG